MICTPAQLQRDLVAEDGVSRIHLTMGDPVPVLSSPVGHLGLSLTPTATTVFIGIDGPVSVTGASVRLSSQVGLAAPGYADVRHIRVWARRKPGTTGALAAQIIQFGKGDGVTLEAEIGRINVLAAAAGEDPVADFFDLPCVGGHANFAIGTSDGFQIDLTAVDTDLEIVMELHWA